MTGALPALLHGLARHARLCLVAGLLAGLGLPGLALAMKPFIPHMVAFTLFVTALRVGPQAAFGVIGEVARSLRLVLVLQVATPLLALGMLALAGLAATPFALAAVFALSASSIAGAPNFAIMVGSDPGPAMRLFVLGTALFPLTVLPLLWLAPGLAGVDATAASLRLVAVILAACLLGFGLRSALGPHVAEDHLRALDGVAALALSVLVIGLMAALGPALRGEPERFLAWLGVACLLNFGVQLFALWAGRRLRLADAVPVSIVAGNRNVALFLIALPANVTDPLLIFVGCYQIPMFLTPIVMKPLHDRLSQG